MKNLTPGDIALPPRDQSYELYLYNIVQLSMKNGSNGNKFLNEGHKSKWTMEKKSQGKAIECICCAVVHYNNSV